MIYLLLFIIGLIFGSFYLVVATRLPEGGSIIKPGSHCDNCKHELSWYELIPVISYLIQGGKCRKCKCHIPLTSPLVEIITGLLFMLSFYLFDISYQTLICIVLFSLGIIIFISDFKYYIISDGPLFTSIIFVLLIKFIFAGYKVGLLSILSGVIFFLFFLLIKYIGDIVFKKESLGGGDIKLAILFGVTLDIKLGMFAFILSAFLALPYALYSSFLKKDDVVPYGPFLILALILVYVFSGFCLDIINSLFLI